MTSPGEICTSDCNSVRGSSCRQWQSSSPHYEDGSQRGVYLIRSMWLLERDSVQGCIMRQELSLILPVQQHLIIVSPCGASLFTAGRWIGIRLQAAGGWIGSHARGCEAWIQSGSGTGECRRPPTKPHVHWCFYTTSVQQRVLSTSRLKYTVVSHKLTFSCSFQVLAQTKFIQARCNL